MSDVRSGGIGAVRTMHQERTVGESLVCGAAEESIVWMVVKWSR